MVQNERKPSSVYTSISEDAVFLLLKRGSCEVVSFSVTTSSIKKIMSLTPEKDWITPEKTRTGLNGLALHKQYYYRYNGSPESPKRR